MLLASSVVAMTSKVVSKNLWPDRPLVQLNISTRFVGMLKEMSMKFQVRRISKSIKRTPNYPL